MFISIKDFYEIVKKLPKTFRDYRAVKLNGNPFNVWDYSKTSPDTKLIAYRLNELPDGRTYFICPTSIFRYNDLVIIEAQSKIYIMNLNVY